ncbi:MAG: STAS domain-containing protein [Ignavibacteriales bacterium]|nr:STAS domain-containing protein [Ignavibacteriales bacterium]
MIKEKRHGRVVVISLKGNFLGEPETSKLREKVHGLLGENMKYVVIDLGRVKVINSMGLGTLVASLVSLRQKGGDLCLARLNEKVEAVIAIMHLVKVFRIYETVERAVKSFDVFFQK